MADQNPSQKKIARIEDLLAGHGLNVSRLCVRAKIARSTWHHWRTGVAQPQTRVWQRVEAALPPKLLKRLA